METPPLNAEHEPVISACWNWPSRFASFHGQVREPADSGLTAVTRSIPDLQAVPAVAGLERRAAAAGQIVRRAGTPDGELSDR